MAPKGLHLAAGNDQIAPLDSYRFRIASVHSVEAKQVGEIFDLDQIIDGDQLSAGWSMASFRIARPIRPMPLMATLVLIPSYFPLDGGIRFRAPRCECPVSRSTR